MSCWMIIRIIVLATDSHPCPDEQCIILLLIPLLGHQIILAENHSFSLNDFSELSPAYNQGKMT